MQRSQSKNRKRNALSHRSDVTSRGTKLKASQPLVLFYQVEEDGESKSEEQVSLQKRLGHPNQIYKQVKEKPVPRLGSKEHRGVET